MLARCGDKSARIEDLDSGGDSVERDFRIALLRGDAESCRTLMDKLDSSVSVYYSALAESGESTPEQISEKLIQCINSKSFPKRLLGETWFYLACLAIELGDTNSALELLAASEQAAPDSPLRPLRRLHYAQLMRNRSR